MYLETAYQGPMPAFNEYPSYPYNDYQRGAGERSLGGTECCCSKKAKTYPVALTSGSGIRSLRHAGMEQSRLFMGDLDPSRTEGKALKFLAAGAAVFILWRMLK